MRQKLTWLMMATHVPPSGIGGGMVRYVVELATALDRHPDVELNVLARPESRSFFEQRIGDASHVAVTPRLPTVARSVLEREGLGIPALARSFDVVHGTKHLLPRHAGGHRVLTVHDMLALDRPHDFNLLKRSLLKYPYRGSLAQADTLLCVSAATRDRLLEHLPQTSGRAVLVPLAPATSLLQTAAEPVPDLVGREFALVVGDPSPRKNLELLVDLWPEVVAARPGAVLAIVGPPSWGRSELGRSHHQLVQQGSLAPLGHVSDAALRWCYENATIALCPSRAEGFGLPAVEALAFGTPLITSTDPALCEVSGPEALHLPASDRGAWAAAVIERFIAGGATRDPPACRSKSWEDVAAETVEAVQRRR